MEDYSDKIFQILAQRNITDAEFCRIHKFKQSTLDGWRNGYAKPELSSIVKFCGCMKITLAEFFSEEDEEEAVSLRPTNEAIHAHFINNVRIVLSLGINCESEAAIFIDYVISKHS